MMNGTTGQPTAIPLVDPSLLDEDTITIFAPTTATEETRDIYNHITRDVIDQDGDAQGDQFQIQPTPISSQDPSFVAPERSAQNSSSQADRREVAGGTRDLLRETLRLPRRLIVALSSCARHVYWLFRRARHRRQES